MGKMPSVSSRKLPSTMFVWLVLGLASFVPSRVSATTEQVVQVDALGETTTLLENDVLEELGTGSSSESIDKDVLHGQNQIAWIRQNGGFVNEKYEIRRADPQDHSSRLAVFAKEDIAKDELLLRIPRSCLLETFNDNICDTVHLLVRELQQGNESHFAPYIAYLQDQPTGQLPTEWTDAGKELMLEMLQDSSLPPHAATSAQWACYQEEEPMPGWNSAALRITQRGWDEVLIPVMDMMSHRNGRHYNTRELYSVHDHDHDVTLMASKFIPKGGELYTSYDNCRDCFGRATEYGTPEIMRDYGFAEMMPQKWHMRLPPYNGEPLAFVLDHQYENDEDDEDDIIAKPIPHAFDLTWNERPDDISIEFLQSKLKGLEEFQAKYYDTQPDDLPQAEWQLIQDYNQAFITALRVLIKTVQEEEDEYDRQNAEDADDEDDSDAQSEPINHGLAQVEWVKSQGGFVSDKLEIRRLNPGEEPPSYGVFALEDIDPQETILEIPRSCLVTTFNDNLCETVDLLARQLKRSKYATPFIKYMKSQPLGQLPGLFSEPGKDLLTDVTWEFDVDEQAWEPRLGPESLVDAAWIGCSGGQYDSYEDALAAMLVQQRGWDETLIPLLDMLQHRNGYHLNTGEAYSIHDPNHPVTVHATKTISKGEEVYSSYDHCRDCGGRKSGYGTAEIFRDYGFVEMYPQTWIFDDVAWGLDEDIEGNLIVTWLDNTFPDEETIDEMMAQVERLEAVGRDTMQEQPDDVPDSEWQMIVRFHEAYLTALKEGAEAAGKERSCIEKGECRLTDDRYNALNRMFDEEGYNRYVCEIDWNFPGYEQLEVVQSNYQKLTYIMDEKNKDVCFSLEETWQQCGSYRPHYHEMMVHYPARFFPKLKRVLWVGGGDSLLLHEIVKYPDLELAVGLELDQQVTRTAFKYFGSQPLWDHPKVQWWYGDAAKSLLMLPKEYFGSFDLILVDLSETVMSMLVTKDLDIMAALSLLMRPEGIFVKNEIYLEKLKPIFENTMQLHFYDVPVLCSQALIFGSDRTDFLKTNLTGHDIGETLVIPPLDQMDYRYHEIHDVVKNPFPRKYCQDPNDAEDASSKSIDEQDKSPGILMILEAEQSDKDIIKSAASLEAALEEALESIGFPSMSTIESSVEDGQPIVNIFMQQGYMTVRSWPDDGYCAFDLHLWSVFRNIDQVKDALLTAVKSKTSSLYRIVAGGMFGAEGWQVDENSRGPSFESCKVPEESGDQLDSAMSNQDIQAIIQESLQLLREEDTAAGVICDDLESCQNSLESVTGEQKLNAVLALHCPNFEGGSESQPPSVESKYDCEKHLVSLLATSPKKVGLLVLDANASHGMGQILHKILSRKKYKNDYFSDELLVLAPMLDKNDIWRRIFVDQMRAIYRRDPVFRSEVLFNSTSSSLEMETFLAGDARFIGRMNEVMESIQNKHNLVADLRNIESGVFPRVADPDPTVFALPKDYDQTGPLEHWRSQKPTGYQTVFQLETNGESHLTYERVKSNFEICLERLALRMTAGPIEISNVGEGAAFAAIWRGGSVVVLWDGRSHIDINLFTFKHGKEFANQFLKYFQRSGASLEVVLRDEQPRGHGRVVNFARDLTGKDPVWATSSDS